MPPPALPVVGAKLSDTAEKMEVIIDPVDISRGDGKHLSTSPTASVKKKAVFKPIGEDSSLKRFFSKDGEDTPTDSPNGSHQLHLKPVTPQVTQPPDNRRSPAHVRAKRPPSCSPSPTVSTPVPEVAITSQATSENSRAQGGTERSPSLPTKDVNGSRTVSVEPVQTPSGQTDAPRSRLYSLVNQVGEGTFGKVYKARNTATGMFVALKRIRMETEKDGFPITSMREIKLLQSLRHKNVVHLHEMMVSEGMEHFFFESVDECRELSATQVLFIWSLSTWTTI